MAKKKPSQKTKQKLTLKQAVAAVVEDGKPLDAIYDELFPLTPGQHSVQEHRRKLEAERAGKEYTATEFTGEFLSRGQFTSKVMEAAKAENAEPAIAEPAAEGTPRA